MWAFSLVISQNLFLVYLVTLNYSIYFVVYIMKSLYTFFMFFCTFTSLLNIFWILHINQELHFCTTKNINVQFCWENCECIFLLWTAIWKILLQIISKIVVYEYITYFLLFLFCFRVVFSRIYYSWKIWVITNIYAWLFKS